MGTSLHAHYPHIRSGQSILLDYGYYGPSR